MTIPRTPRAPKAKGARKVKKDERVQCEECGGKHLPGVDGAYVLTTLMFDTKHWCNGACYREWAGKHPPSPPIGR